jgi:hypothetical protein
MFAAKVTLTNVVPIESVGKILRHEESENDSALSEDFR